MGVKIYWIIVLSVLVLGMIIPQDGANKKIYVFFMAVLHSFVSGFRYMYLTGDLRNYAADFYEYKNLGWFDDKVFQEGRNVGFLWLMKLISNLTNGNFQVLLIIISIIIEVGIAILIFKHSPKPWLSYTVWNCMGFYVFGFSAIKQALAMGILCFAMDALLEKKAVRFYVCVILAGLIHMPAFILLPSYIISKNNLNSRSILGYIALAAVLFWQRNTIVSRLANVYYEDTTFGNAETGLGGRFLMIVIVLIVGLLLKGFREVKFSKLYSLIIIAAVLQMFSGFDNIFTRLADYYWQWSILFIPMIFTDTLVDTEINSQNAYPFLPFNNRSLKILTGCLVLVLIWWYYRTCLSATIEYAVDDYLNFRFMWQVMK